MAGRVTVVGGGLAGLYASIACAEGGAEVELLERRSELGGLARSCEGPYVCTFGPHVLYSDGPHYPWLAERDLLPPMHSPPMTGPARFDTGGRSRLAPPLGVLRALALRRRLRAPVERDFRGWATERFGARTAERLSRTAGVFTFDHDPGRLSAAFVWERLVRVSRLPLAARYPEGGWTPRVDRLAARARELGVTVRTGEAVERLPGPPVILAIPLNDARELTGDETLRWESGNTVMLDLGLRSRRGDPVIVSDMASSGWAETFSRPDPSLAPEGHSLVQAQMPIRPDEDADAALARLEVMLDRGYRGWRKREVWRRRMLAEGRTGALDLPGRTWRDRPAVDRGHGVFLAGDAVAAPGLLSEVSFHSAMEAARLALAATGARTETPARAA